MTLATVFILVAVPALVLLLAVAPSAPARRNPSPRPGRRPAHRRLSHVPGQRTMRRHAR